METFKLGKTKIKMPSGWHEVNYKKAFEILSNKPNEIKTLSILSGKTEKEIRTSSDSNTLYYFFTAFEFLGRLPEHINEFPNSVKLGVDHLVFPFVSYADEFDLGQCEVGQVEDMLALIVKMNKEFIGDEERELTDIELIQIFPYLVAIYIQRILDGKYIGKKAIKLVDRVKEELSFKEITCMGAFFLNRLTYLKNGSMKELKRRNSIQRKLKLALKNLIQRMVSILP